MQLTANAVLTRFQRRRAISRAASADACVLVTPSGSDVYASAEEAETARQRLSPAQRDRAMIFDMDGLCLTR